MKKLIQRINPVEVFKSLIGALKELLRYRKYSKILKELDEEKKLSEIGIKLEKNLMYIGVNLNPELLLYGGESQESVELKFVSEAMMKYTDFLQKEGILDAISADYERIYNENFYGYLVQIKFKMSKYKLRRLLYDLGYILTATSGTIAGIFSIVNKFI